jgi:glycosyltransferase involved in cell wall biosynthesis
MAMSSRPSVLVITHGFPPNSIAGTEQHVRGLVETLSDRYDFHVLSRDAAGAHEGQDGIVLRVPPGAAVGSVDELVEPHDAAFERVLLRQLDDFQPDLVHIHHWIHLSNSLVELCAGRAIPVVITLHDHYPICPRTDLLRRGDIACSGPEGGQACADCLEPPGAVFQGESFTHRCARVILSRRGRQEVVDRWARSRAAEIFRTRLDHMRSELELAFALICPSAALKRELTSVWPELEPRLSVLRHGIAADWAQAVKRAPSDQVRFAFVGSLAPHKGVEVLLEAFRGVDAGAAALALFGAWVCPDPSYEQRIARAAAAVNATIHGRYEPPDLPAIYSQVDVAVVPSICKESASLAVLEALAGGAPVIASDLGALPEVVAHGTNGLLFRAGDAADLAEKMSALVRDPALLSRLRRGVQPPKSLRQYAAQIAEIYQRAVGG